MTEATTRTPPELVDELSAVLARMADDLEPLRDEVRRVHARAPGRPSVAELAGLRPAVLDLLAGHDDLVAGAGYVPAPGVLADRSRWLEWWTGGGGGEPARLSLDSAPGGGAAFDYTDQPWFTVPAATGLRHLTGPYVDYFCTDDYTLTLTTPVRRDGEFLGVVGLDVFVGTVERLVLPRMRELGRPAALVNAQGRVVVSTSVREVTGSLVRSPDVAGLWDGRADPQGAAVTWCREFPLGLLVAA